MARILDSCPRVHRTEISLPVHMDLSFVAITKGEVAYLGDLFTNRCRLFFFLQSFN
jgi:hypothetical protein